MSCSHEIADRWSKSGRANGYTPVGWPVSIVRQLSRAVVSGEDGYSRPRPLGPGHGSLDGLRYRVAEFRRKLTAFLRSRQPCAVGRRLSTRASGIAYCVTGTAAPRLSRLQFPDAPDSPALDFPRFASILTQACSSQLTRNRLSRFRCDVSNRRYWSSVGTGSCSART